ncbi:cytochrome P450 [Planosporangium sp. 12N6]|uniref:cytochrome P450 n=1 Tax=Planosporangium spinosum TaxID=3402278 RepID=UPI003CEBAB92
MTGTVDRGAVGEVVAALGAPAGQADPYPIYRRLRAWGPAVTAPDGTLFVTGYRACAALLRDHRLRKEPQLRLAAAGYPQWWDRPSLRLLFTSILTINPPEHTRLRRLVSTAFTPRRVAALRPAVEAIVAELCERTAGETDFVTAFAFPLPVTVIGELLGVPSGDRPMFQDLVRDWTAVLDTLAPDRVGRADTAAVTIRDYLADLAAQRRASPADDLISALVGATGAGADRLTADELTTMAALLLAAGFETTTLLLANSLVALLDHPEQAARLRKRPDLAEAAVEELLRYDSPVQLLSSRSSPVDVEIGGVALAAGQQIVTLLGAANRDPEVFTDPDVLRLDRAEAPPLSFGGGVHHCLGAPLARLETRVALPALLTRFPRLALAGTPESREGLALHGYCHLPVHAR